MARSSSIARRYARAYFDLAAEAGDIEGWGRQLTACTTALGQEEIAHALSNPRLSFAERTTRAMSLLDGVAQPARNLSRLLVERGRVALISDVLEHYRRLADRASGVVRAEVLTAIEPDERLTGEIARILSERLGGGVRTDVRRDPAILGGLVVRIGDRVIDDSVRTHLQQLQAALA